MFAVDTNIFIYAHFDRYEQHDAARLFCQKKLLSAQDWCLGWQIVYEYIRIVTHPKIHKRPLNLSQALADFEPYLARSTCHLLVPTPQHQRVLESVIAEVPSLRGNVVHDLHYAALLKEHGIKTLYTADSDFRKLGFLAVIDPTH